MGLSSYDLYYFETNIICIALLLIIFYIYSKERYTADAIYFKNLLLGIIFYSIFDIVAALTKSMTFPGVRTVLYVSNALYVGMPLVLAALWEVYTSTRLALYGYKRTALEKSLFICSAVLYVAVLSSPFTGYAFSIDADNMYHRSIGAYITPAFGFVYLAAVCAKIYVFRKSLFSLRQRQTASTLTYFIYPPILASIVQIFIYGVTLAQIGMTFGAFMMFVFDLRNQVSEDQLTGLNNRNEYDRFVNMIESSANYVMVAVVDLDKFKSINDNFGHIMGDRAIKEIANVFVRVVQRSNNNLFIARYGGDEFVILSRKYEPGLEETVKTLLCEEMDRTNDRNLFPIPLKYSIGIASGSVKTKGDVEKLFKQADKAMYDMKNSSIR